MKNKIIGILVVILLIVNAIPVIGYMNNKKTTIILESNNIQSLTLEYRREIQKLVASDGEADDRFGHSVSIYGNYALIGAPDDDSSRGSAYVFKREVTNLPLNKPVKPSGEINGKVNIPYTYSTRTNDPDGDQIFYWFEWGDGSNSGWIGPFNSGATVNASHSWAVEGNYQIKVKAKDTFGAESDWSDPLSVTMPRSRAIDNPILRFFENHPLIFRILQSLSKQLQAKD